jgi:hypothetical protein
MTLKQDRVADMAPVLATVLRRAAVRATLAASVRNSQPWRLVLHPDHLVVQADRARWLPVFDPTGRQLLMSCGAAVLNARAALAAGGFGEELSWAPDAACAGEPDDLALLRPRKDMTDVDGALAKLDWAAPRRRSSWGPFSAPAGADLLAALVASARAHGAELVPVEPEAAARASRLAARVLDEDPAYVAELRAWRTVDPRRRDGLPCGSRPVGPDTSGSTWLPDARDWGQSSCLVLSTPTDAPAAWVRAGEALQRVLLTATTLGAAVHVMSLPIEVPAARQMVAHAAGCPGYAQLVLRVGVAEPAPASARRRLVEVIRTVGSFA